MTKEASPMTPEQIEIITDTLADVPKALQELEATNPELVKRVRDQQSDVAETFRRARSNPDILNLRIGSLASRGD